MKLRIAKDYFDTPMPPRLFLCTTSNKIIGELPAYDIGLNASWNKYSELRFSIDRQYTDVLTGETVVNPLFDKAEGLRKIYVENMGYFIIQDPDTTYSDKDTKSLSCFSSEYETSTKYLENFYINTGDDESVEVTYLEGLYGADYTVKEDDRYELAPLGENNFDAYEGYYVKEYSDTDSYTFQEVAIADASVYITYDQSTVAKTLYVRKYSNVRFYWPTKPELSLLHLVFKKIPGWTIGTVDLSLQKKERKFSEDRVAVYDFLMNEVADTIKCVVEWDALNNKVNFYEEAEDGITEDNTIQTRFDTDIYIARENLANEINIRYSSDDIKTKLKVTGSDDLNIRDVNLGKNYIINLDFYRNEDWMEKDLIESYDDYLKAVEEYAPLYSEAVSARAGAYNRWNDLMNAVPAEGNVVLIGDPFEKLYCSYTPTDTAYYNKSFSVNGFVDDLYSDEDCMVIIDKESLNGDEAFVVQGYHFAYKKDTNKFKCVRNIALGTAKTELIAKLNSYHVNEDVNGNKTDNILLRLKDKDKNTITIRIYAPPIAAEKYEAGKKYYRKYNANGRDFYSETSVQGDDIAGLYTTSENYEIHYELFNDDSGIENTNYVSDLDDWIRGNITAEKLGRDLFLDSSGLTKYTISYIGTMGAYFVLAKDETKVANLEDYGVNLLKEKHDTYTLIFQTQTENMYSQEKYQCVSSDNPPEEPIPNNTRWLDTSVSPSKLYIYDTENYYGIGSYVEGMVYYDENKSIAAPQPTKETFKDNNYYIKWRLANSNEVSAEDKSSHEDYKRYLDNYQKLQAVQQVLIEKEAEAEYCLNGHAVSDMRINVSDYIGENHSNSNGESLTNSLKKAAKKHFPDDGIIDLEVDYDLPLYKFACSAYPNVYAKATVYDENTIYYIEENGEKIQAITQPTAENFSDGEYYILEKDYTFAVYLQGKTPYVAFASSVGVHQAKMNYYSQLTDFENYFTEDQWIRMSPFIREDEFNDNNFLLTGYESEEERMSICQELMETASKELKTLSQPSLEFSMNIGNILALPEFNALTSQFELGNFIRIELRPSLVKRARLLSVDLDFDDLSSFSCQFGNLVTTQDQIDLHAELMQQAVQAGKQVAASASNWQKAVDKSNKLEEDIANGLQDATLEIGKANGQNIEFGKYGLRGRKLIEGTTDQYEDEQVALINNKLVFTADGWKTSKAAFGKFVVDGVEHWGVLSDAVISGFIEGATIRGGNLRIGDGSNNYFQVSESGDVSIVQAGKEKYASINAVQAIDDAYRYQIILLYDKSTIFGQPNQTCTLTCKVYELDEDITSKLPTGTTFSWLRNGVVYKTTTTPTLTVTNSDVDKNSIFSCSVTFDETKMK